MVHSRKIPNRESWKYRISKDFMKKEDAEIPGLRQSSTGVVQLSRISSWVKLCFLLYFQHSRAESKVANLKISGFS